jgi:TonB family protein
MRRFPVIALSLALAGGAVLAHGQLAPSTQEGPSGSAPASAPAPVPLPPKPFPDRTFPVGNGVVAPRIVKAAPAVYPSGEPAKGTQGECLLSLTVTIEGVPINIRVLRTRGEAFDAAATDAVKASQFAPGTLNNEAVPVRVMIRVPFTSDHSPAVPAIFEPDYVVVGVTRPYDRPPAATHTEAATYTDEARVKEIRGVVIVSLLVTADGLPTNLHVEKSLGYGLDDRALQAVAKYRFKPAMRDGAPIGTRLVVEVNFRLY